MKRIIYDNPTELDLPEYVVQSLTDQAELAHIRHFDEETFIIINFPTTLNSIHPICIKLEENEMTLYTHQTILLEEDLSRDYVHDIIIIALKRYEGMVKVISKQLRGYEDSMDTLMTKENAKVLFRLNRRLIRYQTAINAIGDVSDYIMNSKPYPIWQEAFASEYTNIHIEVHQLDQNIEMYQQIIESLVDVSEALFSNKLNRTMKTLTSVTLVISVPTFMTSFYGMNIDLPFQDHPQAPLIVFGITLILTLIIVMYLYKHDLF